MIKVKGGGDPLPPPEKDKPAPFIVRVAADLLDWVDQKAEELDLSRNEYVTGLLERARKRG